MRSASSAIRMARMRPTAAAISADAPPSGISPILVNASMKNAFSEASTTSHARASETPTPAAAPCTTATAGCGRFDDRADAAVGRVEHVGGCPSGAGVGVVLFADPGSGAEAAAGPPMRTTRTLASPAARSSVSANVLQHRRGERVQTVRAVARSPSAHRRRGSTVRSSMPCVCVWCPSRWWSCTHPLPDEAIRRGRCPVAGPTWLYK